LKRRARNIFIFVGPCLQEEEAQWQRYAGAVALVLES
jgi:hypothetical protein